MNRRTFVRGALGAVVAATSATAVYTCGIETHWIERKTVLLSIGLKSALRVAVLGDLHFDPLYEKRYLEHAVSLVNGLEPDLILYTGDFVSHDTSRIGEFMALLSQGVARFGSFAVLGNHDHWAGAKAVIAALARNNIRLLLNESVLLPGEDHFFLTGLDSYWSGKPDPSVIVRSPKDSRHLLLVHEPDPFDRLTDPRIRLQISGHTHGGQVRIPFVGAVRLPRWGLRYDVGLYTPGDRKLYVNRGLGTIRPHIRFDCAPEITLFELS